MLAFSWVNDWRMFTQRLLTAIRDDVAFSFALTLQDDGIVNLTALFGCRIRRALIRNGTLPSTLTVFGSSQLSMLTLSALLFSSSPSFKSSSERPSTSSNALRAYAALLDRLVHLVEPAHFCELIPDYGATSFFFPWLL